MLRTLGHRYSQAEVEEMIKNADKNGEMAVMLLMVVVVVVSGTGAGVRNWVLCYGHWGTLLLG